MSTLFWTTDKARAKDNTCKWVSVVWKELLPLPCPLRRSLHNLSNQQPRFSDKQQWEEKKFSSPLSVYERGGKYINMGVGSVVTVLRDWEVKVEEVCLLLWTIHQARTKGAKGNTYMCVSVQWGVGAVKVNEDAVKEPPLSLDMAIWKDIAECANDRAMFILEYLFFFSYRIASSDALTWKKRWTWKGITAGGVEPPNKPRATAKFWCGSQLPLCTRHGTMQKQVSGNCKEETISTLYYRSEMSHRLEATNQMLVELNDRLEAQRQTRGEHAWCELNPPN